MADRLLEGETALVTGAASGIGRGIALEASREGAAIALADVNEEAGRAAASAIEATGGHAVFLPCDLSDPDAAERLVEAAIAKLGRLSLVVHAAAPRRREIDTVMSVSPETFAAMLNVNVTSAFRLARRAARHMIDEKIAGRMLLVTSLHAERPRNLPHYSAGKAGMTMLVKELAHALGSSGIRVNALAPGAIVTGGVVLDQSIAKSIALGRTGTPDDIAPMAIAVLSERFGRYVTGTTIVVDGGLALHSWFEPKL
jgi:NAD(P)-dependent dehydrogenase (short-subunit alcohol dehydrogenase family)